MATAGTLTVRVLADTGKFSRGMKNAKTDLTTFQTASGRAKTALAGLTAAFIAAGAAAATFAIKSQLAVLDTLQKTFDKLGVSTNELMFWQHAAGLAGASTSEMNKAFEQMQFNVSHAARGLGQAKNAIEFLGLDAQKLAQSTPHIAMERIAAAIQQIGNQQDRLAIARDIFGRSGAQMLNVFASNLGAVRQKFDDLGLGLKEGQSLRPIEQLNDAVSTLKQALSVSGRDLIIGITPAALAIVNSLTETLKAMGIIGAEKKGPGLIGRTAASVGGAYLAISESKALQNVLALSPLLGGSSRAAIESRRKGNVLEMQIQKHQQRLLERDVKANEATAAALGKLTPATVAPGV